MEILNLNAHKIYVLFDRAYIFNLIGLILETTIYNFLKYLLGLIDLTL